MLSKRCGKCGTDKPITAYPPSAISGKKQWAMCRDCRNVYYRGRRRTRPVGYFYQFTKKRRDAWAEWMAAYKTARGCKQCGERHPAALDFHHRDHTAKGHNIAAMVAKAAPRGKIIAEIAKCDLLCSNCHRKAHHADGNVVFRRPEVLERQRRNNALAASLPPRPAPRGIHRKALMPWKHHLLARFARAS